MASNTVTNIDVVQIKVKIDHFRFPIDLLVLYNRKYSP